MNCRGKFLHLNWRCIQDVLNILSNCRHQTQHQCFNWPYFVGSETPAACCASWKGSQKPQAGGLKGRKAHETCRLCCVTEELGSRVCAYCLDQHWHCIFIRVALLFWYTKHCLCWRISLWRAKLRCRGWVCYVIALNIGKSCHGAVEA